MEKNNQIAMKNEIQKQLRGKMAELQQAKEDAESKSLLKQQEQKFQKQISQMTQQKEREVGVLKQQNFKYQASLKELTENFQSIEAAYNEIIIERANAVDFSSQFQYSGDDKQTQIRLGADEK